MAEQNNNFKEKFAAFWSIKRNKIITSAVGGVLVVGIVLAIVLPIALNNNHTHKFNETWEYDETYHWHASTCKHDVVDGKEKHDFKDEITNPTKDKDGYTTHTCTICQYSYTDSNVPSIQKQEALGMIPAIHNANNTISYGLYPQSRVKDENTLSALGKLTTTESNGWYLYNDEYYASIDANPYHSFANFEDGTSIERGKTYWFKCEPINWNILKSSDGVYSLVSSVLLDTHIYDSDSNNYKDSEIRSWLNNEFLNTAFNLNSSYIETTEVNNSASTTKFDPNQYASENTNDKVYLLSYKDYLNSSYGYSTSDGESDTRQCKITDFANANGAYYSTTYSYSGFYWTRSPNTAGSNSASYVYQDGSLTRNLFADYEGIAVRPAITINLKLL